MKKNSVMILLFCFLVIALVGCSGGSGEGSGQETEDGRVILTGTILKHPLTKSLDDMEWLAEAEERAGVSIEWEEVSADWDERKNAMLAGGDIPDIIVGPNVITDADFAQFTGLFQDLSELMEHAPNVQTMFEEKQELEIIATQNDGQIYGLPKYQRFWPDTATRQFINTDWLDNLGLDMPTTWDELHEVLLAFKEEDANGNGDPNDEIPFDWAPVGTGGFGFFHPTVFLGSTGITLSESGTGYFAEDGEIKNFFMDERYKEVVIFLNKLYADGLINSEVFTQEYTNYQATGRGDGDTAKVGFTFGWEATDRFGNQLAPQYTSMAPLKMSDDSTDDVRWNYDSNVLNYGENMIQMSAETHDKEAAMRFINEIYDPEVSMQVLFGSIGESIEDNGDGTYSILPPGDESMDPGTWKWTNSWADNGPMYISDSLELELGTDMQSVGSQTDPLQEALDRADEHLDVYPSIFIKYSQEDNNAMSLRNTELMNLAMAKFAEWVTEGNVEDGWDDYIENLTNLGMPETIDTMQTYYDEYLSEIE